MQLTKWFKGGPAAVAIFAPTGWSKYHDELKIYCGYYRFLREDLETVLTSDSPIGCLCDLLVSLKNLVGLPTYFVRLIYLSGFTCFEKDTKDTILSLFLGVLLRLATQAALWWLIAAHKTAWCFALYPSGAQTSGHSLYSPDTAPSSLIKPHRWCILRTAPGFPVRTSKSVRGLSWCSPSWG